MTTPTSPTPSDAPIATTTMPAAPGRANGASALPSLVLIGAGATGHMLASQLAPYWRVTVVDLREPDQPTSSRVRWISGDATSRLVLNRADAAEARWIIITTGDDEINLEVCRVLRDLDRSSAAQTPTQVAVLLNRAENEARCRALGAEPLLRTTAAAAMVRNLVEHRVRSAQSIGLGEGDIVEVTVQERSPVIDRPLRLLAPERWLVAAIYRAGRLVIPHGDTVIAAGDRVVLVGEPAVLTGVAEFIRAGSLSFPAVHGEPLVVGLVGGPDVRVAREVALLAASAPEAPVMAYPVGNTAGTWRETLRAALDEHGVLPRLIWLERLANPSSLRHVLRSAGNAGCLVIPDTGERPWSAHIGLQAPWWWSLLYTARAPLLLARGSAPYQEVQVVATTHPSSGQAVYAALAMAEQVRATLRTIAVRAPDDEDQTAVGSALASAQTVASGYRRTLDQVQSEGNPIREVLRLAGAGKLTVVGHRQPPTGRPRAAWWWPIRPDVSAEIARRSTNSVLVVPWRPA